MNHDETDSLRDQFAMAALNGLLSYSLINPMRGNYHENCSPADAARTAYLYAEEMLKARKEYAHVEPQRVLRPPPYKSWCEEHKQAAPCLICDYEDADATPAAEGTEKGK